MTCTVSDCDRPAHGNTGYCKGIHYVRWRKYGDPLGGGAFRILGDHERRFLSKVTQTATCWVWTGVRTDPGATYRANRPNAKTFHIYGIFSTGQVKIRAHRWSYEHWVGPIPEGKQLDHLCRNTLCVRPEHLEPVTGKENVNRGTAAEVNRTRNLAKTHCPQGHPWDAANTIQTPRQRVCRACRVVSQRKTDAKRKAARRATKREGA